MSPIVTPGKATKMRAQLWAVIHDGHGRSGQAFQLLLVILILLSVAMLPLEFGIEDLEYGRVLLALEVIITSIFTVEYVLRIYSAPKRMHYIFSPAGIIDLFSILPFYLGLFDTQFLRSLKIMRIIRLLRLGEVRSAGSSQLPAAVDDQGHGLLQEDEKYYSS